MLLYDYQIFFDKINHKQPKSKVLKESKTLLVDNSHILLFSNNQNRRVAITSDKSFSDNQTNQSINFLVEDVVTFSVKKGEDTIYYKLYKEGTQSLAIYWFSHTFLPILFTMEDVYYFLHAGAVEIDSKSVLFVADSGGGKSTMTDFFIKKDHTMISDDKVAVYEDDRGVIAVPSYAYHRPYRKVEDLGYPVENFAKESKPMHVIFNLVKSDAKAQIIIEEVFGIEKFRILKFSTEIELHINSKSRFAMLSKIANNVKLYNIYIPWDMNRLEEVYEKIVNFIKKDK
jgi:hypothetical protein